MTSRRRANICFLTSLLCALLLCASLSAQAQMGVPAAHADAIDTHVEGIIKSLTLYLARFVELAAAVVIGIASLRGIVAYFASVATRTGGTDVPKEAIRLALGRSLALALEFELGADILKTAVAPTWNDIGLLAAIAVLRTALNYFLERELRNAEMHPPAAVSNTFPGSLTEHVP